MLNALLRHLDDEQFIFLSNISVFELRYVGIEKKNIIFILCLIYQYNNWKNCVEYNIIESFIKNS